MPELPLLDGILKYIRENNISFCMPGHKNGKGFYNTSIGREFADNILKFDITEVNGVDNLHNQKGIILDASERLRDFYGSKKSYFLVNGSTSGNMIMLFSSFNEGDKILVERNCHNSILNAIIMRKLNPVYLKNIISKRLNAPAAINLEHFLQVIRKNTDAKGVVITYPNYYGLCSNLKFIIKEAKKYNMKVLVDCAHGAHFGVHPDLPESAVKLGADMVVTSAHKTLCSLTQSAYLHVNNERDIDKVDFYFDAFSSTSPSYISLCSMDYARFYLEKYGHRDYGELIRRNQYYRNKVNSMEGFSVIGREDISKFNSECVKEKNILPGIWNIDLTRYIINLDKDHSGNLLSNYLRKTGIQCEMSDSSNVILIFSPFNQEEEYEKLCHELKNCNLKQLKYKRMDLMEYGIPEIRILPYEVLNAEKQMVDLKNCINRISGVNVIPYPPGVPIVLAGELINKDVAKIIEYYAKSVPDLIGVKDNKIKVLK
ncbi:aminotransferase class I/II-fold pyridoxal phosphate-dependent enzyme [Clostridium luticellarii]|uniref:aminotransferase class I/II-fold pyridoxal phosphate-dependent enzyme n=1 Tax=Clostridium luticellarii TaxID=1691940 RepID=UPI00235614C6|nr:aminotransferase class V-fold PLP-dependent enzyme [Clostridium luticellarii]MCI1944885.1 aminotransferase class V-fold PLP-dependent enzyme [Clostridium luticellarii]MCI1968439.1 aminotransferase class V-fold PLP-dependent enzyme [Clostridium luticellarii]